MDQDTKPGELSTTIHYLLTEEDTVSNNEPFPDNLQEGRTKLRPWQPVWSSLAFMVVVLAIGCWYIERQEF